MATLGFMSKDQRGSKSVWIIPRRSMIYCYTGDYNIGVLWSGVHIYSTWGNKPEQTQHN